MNTVRTALALMLLAASSLSSVAQQTPPGAGEAQEPAPETAPEATAPPPRDNRPLDEIFIPSEEIAADEEVTFPVNI